MRRLLITGLISILILLTPSPSPTLACDGRGSFLHNYQMYTTIVTGHITRVSDSGVNAVLTIDKVLKGQSPRQIILGRNSIQEIQIYTQGRGIGGMCDPMAPRLSQGDRFVASLNRSPSGIYYGAIIPENENGYFVLEAMPEDQVQRTYEEMTETMAQLLNQVPWQPEESPKPLPVALHLYTESAEYGVASDDRELYEAHPEQRCVRPVEPPLNPCIDRVFAPNHIDNVSLYPDFPDINGLTFYSRPFAYAVQGEAATFSTGSDLLLVWHEQEMRVYITRNQHALSNRFVNELTLLRTWTPGANDSLLSGAGAWNPNGRLFAFSSEAGIWFWDVLTPGSEPALFLSTDQHPIRVLHFSPGGNYLALESGSRRYNLDIHSLLEYPDGLFSWDDRLLAAYDTQAEGLADLQLFRVLPDFVPILTYNIPTNEFDVFVSEPYTIPISQLQWIGTSELLISACAEGDFPPYGRGDLEDSWCKVRRIAFGIGGEWIEGTQFAYDPVTDSLAILQEDNTIYLNGEIMEFGDRINEPITHIEIEALIDIHHLGY